MRLLKKLVVATTVLSVSVASLPIGGYETMAAEAVDVTVSNVTYSFTNSNPGYADGIITVTASVDTSFDLYWGNATGAKLQKDGVNYSSLGTITTAKGTGTFDIISPYTAIPEGAAQLLVYNGDEKEYAYSIPSNKQWNRGTKKYSFGIMSDIHYNRYNLSGQDDAISAFNKALTFMESKAKVSFVAGLGDLSAYSEDSSFINYGTELAKHNIKMYTCMGNHDVYNQTGWKKYINTGMTTDKSVLEIADNELDFVYQYPGATEDVFIFLSQTRWLYNTSTAKILTDDQLNWIEEMLAKYADKNVFLMFHTYVSTNTGDVKNCTGNLVNPGGYFYDLTYTVGATDEVKMKALLNKYPNVTMFSGHSHWSYAMQKFNPYLNIGQLGTGARLVHVSSVTEPRAIGTNDTTRSGLNNIASEAMLADVYGNCVVYTGVDAWNGEYLAYATYISENGAKGTAEVIKVPAKAKVKSATKNTKKAKKAKIVLKKIKNAQGYEIEYSTSKKFKVKKTTVMTTKKLKVTLKGLKPKKTYYVRVRAYLEKYGKIRYGKWSKRVKIKVKKK